jgi:protein HOOK3
VLQEKGTLDKVYQQLLEEHRQLQTSVDDLTSEKEEALARARQAVVDADRHRDDKAEPAFKAEIDRLRVELCVDHCFCLGRWANVGSPVRRVKTISLQ